ncbi:PLDc N-terminal domain-containing protein [Echinicola marina]|uniref:PLDc N-terminal domain-containing protein n=1 Tax=Echinicola marina TaxID=2859768 RepID=UPI001CF6A800|nr:PLDc N-terminal domain-containing protein [Echinicola marina]UCS94184.1 PLDc N-terminal domain-containing protein [Echinicola marina]
MDAFFSLGIFGFLFTIVPLVLFIWALVDVIQARFASSDTKIIWVIVIILVPFIGSILYLIIGRNNKI